MAELSIHAIDVTMAVPATGMRVTVRWIDPSEKQLFSGEIDSGGTIPKILDNLANGIYEAVFEIAEFYRMAGYQLPDPA